MYQSHLGREAAEQTGLGSVDLGEARLSSKETGKLILAQFSAVWCAACRALDQRVLSNPSVQKYIGDHYVFSRLDYETENQKQYFRRYDISRFPSILVMNSKGEVLRQLPVTFDPEKFLSAIKI